MKTKKIITVELVETNVFSRWHCTVCDGCTNPVSVLAGGKDGKRAIRVCEQCLEDAKIDKRLAATAAAHERHAAYLRSLVGRLRVPTYAAWKARIEKVEASRPWRLEVHDQDRTVGPGADQPANFQAVGVRQHQIKDDDIHRLPFVQREPACPVLGMNDVEARLAEVLAEHPSKTEIIFDQEDALAQGCCQPVSINRDASAPTDH